jgi:hypothetical protein
VVVKACIKGSGETVTQQTYLQYADADHPRILIAETFADADPKLAGCGLSADLKFSDPHISAREARAAKRCIQRQSDQFHRVCLDLSSIGVFRQF